MTADTVATTTVGDYLATRLAQIGLDHHFVVPGDYNLILLDKLQENPKLKEINCANELNMSFAAEGYARAKGVSACVVTFSVGAFSAFNGVGSAYAENLPVIMISGAPNTNDAPAFHLLHHTIATHDFDYQYEMVKKITCAAVQIKRAVDAPALIDHAIRSALANKKPSYIEIPTNIVTCPIPVPGPISAVIPRLLSDPKSLEVAVSEAAKIINSKKKPVLMAGTFLRSAEAEGAFVELAEALGCAVTVMPNAKSFFPEGHPQYAGIYWGQISTKNCESIVQGADVLIAAGCLFNDYTTTGWTAIPVGPAIKGDGNEYQPEFLDFGKDSIKLPGLDLSEVRLAEFLSALAKKVKSNPATLKEYDHLRPEPTEVAIRNGHHALKNSDIANQVQKLLTPSTTLMVETGDSWFNGEKMDLPTGARFEIEMQWGSIGWCIPATFGYAVGAPDRRIICLVGDGSFQVTAQEVSQMVRLNLPIIIVLVNNHGYTIEAEIHDGSYNLIKNWDYGAVIEGFNSTDGHAIGLKANTVGELSAGIKTALGNTQGPTLIECDIAKDDCTRELVTWGKIVAAVNARKN